MKIEIPERKVWKQTIMQRITKTHVYCLEYKWLLEIKMSDELRQQRSQSNIPEMPSLNINSDFWIFKIGYKIIYSPDFAIDWLIILIYWYCKWHKLQNKIYAVWACINVNELI